MTEIGVYICVYNRLQNIPVMLKQLDQQTFKKFDLYILNNNIFEKEKVEQLVKENKGSLGITIKHMDYNTGPMIRFVEARNSTYPYVVFLDDDEDFGCEMMETFNKEKSQKTLSARVASNFDDKIHVRTRIRPGENAKYLGPGGMIADASIFRNEDFWKEWKPEFYVIDDCWLSYFAKKIGFRLISSKAVIMLRNSEMTSMLKNETIRSLKQIFVEKYNWKGKI